jgi:hypothetical protein
MFFFSFLDRVDEIKNPNYMPSDQVRMNDSLLSYDSFVDFETLFPYPMQRFSMQISLGLFFVVDKYIGDENSLLTNINK